MKKLLLTLVMSLVLVFPALVSADSLYIGRGYLSAGNEAELGIVLANDTPYCALQTDLYLPEDVNLVEEYGDFVIDPTPRFSRNHVVSSKRQADGSVRILVTSQSSLQFAGNDGPVVLIRLRASEKFRPFAEASLRNSIVVESDGTKHKLFDATSKIGGLRGDVDVNGVVNVSDVTALINDILELADWDDFICDVDMNGVVNVSDVTALISLIL